VKGAYPFARAAVVRSNDLEAVMRIKMYLLGICMVMGLGMSTPAQAQMVVSDPGGLFEQITFRLQQAEQFLVQIDKMRIQYEMMKATYDAATGARNLGDIFDNPLLRQYLPQEWVAIYDQINKMGYNAMTQAQREIYQANQAFDACARIEIEDERLTCEALAIQASVKKGLIVPAIQMTAQRSMQIKALMKRMGETKDMKEAAELQGRINAEQAQIANAQAEIMMYQIEADTEKELLEQKQREQISKTFAKRGGIEIDLDD
jgi:type IV secretion system protein VirB5